MSEERVSIFISHIHEEQAAANRIKNYLEQVFRDRVDVFVASEIPPGDDWFERIMEAVDKSHIVLVMASGESITRPWIHFETGAAWVSKRARVIPLCYKQMTPGALPEPLRRLQAVDINTTTEAEQMAMVAEAIRKVAPLPQLASYSVEDLPLSSAASDVSSVRGWVLRAGAHVGEEVVGTFRVGNVAAADALRAQAASLDPADTIYVRLYTEPATGQYLNTMAAGAIASIFERDGVEDSLVRARLKLSGVYESGIEGDRPVPVIVIQEAELLSR